MTGHKPSPEELLRLLESQESDERRGRLKVFLGYAPRVGKSCRMFDEGNRRKKRGQDVVVGAVQPRGAQEIAEKISMLEVIGTDRLDIDRIVERNPQVCLVDELAVDNPAGSRHPKRWQDVEELLDHGINVITALNLQHIEEQQDAVARITGKRSAHSVPQSFIRGADEIVVVDAPASQEALDANLDLARRLGAEIHILEGADPVEEIVRFAHEHRMTQIFIGHTQRSR